MKELSVAMLHAELPGGAGALWQGRGAPAGAISIEAMLDERLPEIRASHMEWAYEIGQMPIGNGQSLQRALECGAKPSMWWTSLIYERHPKLSPWLYPVYKLRCVELLLEEGGYEGLALIGGDERMRRALKRMCAAKGLRFRALSGVKPDVEAKPFKRRLYELAPAPIRALARYAHWLLKIRRGLPFVGALPRLPSGASPAATIAVYFPNIDLRAAGAGRFRSRYWEGLHAALNEEAKRERPGGPHFVRWLLIRFPSPDLDFSECLRLRDLFQKEGKDGLSFNYLEEFLSGADLRAALGRWLRLAIQGPRLGAKFARACHFRGSDLNFWPYLKWQWRESIAGWRSLERCLLNRAFLSYARMAGPQRWSLFPLENCPWERMLTVAARGIAGSGPVYGAQHSTVRPTDFRYFDDPRTFSAPDCAEFQPDVIAGNGKAALGQWLANGMPAARLRQVEALRYLYLAEQAPEREAEPPPPQPGEPLEHGSGRRLLILTSFFKDETEAHLRLARQGLEAGLFEGWRLVLKPHPYLQPEDWLAGLPGRLREKIFVSRAPLALELSPGTSVWASNSTTGSLEAALKGLPVMVMAACGDFDLCPIQGAPGLLRTASINDIKSGLERLEPLRLEPDYLDLGRNLRAWRELLDLPKN